MGSFYLSYLGLFLLAGGLGLVAGWLARALAVAGRRAELKREVEELNDVLAEARGGVAAPSAEPVEVETVVVTP